MDSTLKKVYSMSPEQISACEKKVMLGSGQHGICFREGKGVRLTDVDGNSYIDCTAQGWALLLGHANEEIRQVAYEQMGMLTHLNQNSDSLPRFALADACLLYTSLPALTQRLESRFFHAVLRDRTRPVRDIWAGLEEDTLRGVFLRKLRAAYDTAQDADRQTIEAAVRYGLAAMENREEPQQ